MPLSNYGELKASIADFLNRNDLTAQIPDFIRLFESRANDRVRVRQGLLRTTLVLTGQFTAAPEGLEEIESCWIPSPHKKIGVITTLQAAVERERTANATGPLESVSVVGNEIEAFPTPSADTTLSLVYFQTVPPLAADEDSNWLLDKYPDLYLYGSLIASAPFLKDDDRLQMWTALHDTRLEEANIAGMRAKLGGGTIRVRRTAIG